MALMSYIVRKIGLNRGRPRVYLETSSLEAAGFGPGKAYSRSVDLKGKRITLKAVVSGEFLVSKKEKCGKTMPVIDIHNAEILSAFDGMDAVRIVIEAGLIHILPLASEVNRTERLARLRESLRVGQLRTAGVSFGGGILDHAAHAGFESAGIQSSLELANEIDEGLLDHACAHNDIWRSSTVALAAPMQELVQDAVAMSRLKPVDILAMGIPCSGASKAGASKRKLAMMEDHPEVGHLIASALMLVNRIQPSVVVVENVPEYEATASAQILRQHLRDSGYQVHERVLRARDFGCMESRNRWFLVAATNGIEISLDGLEPSVYPVRALSELLEPVDASSPEWRSFDYLKTKEVRDAQKGNGFAMQVVSSDSHTVPTLRKGYHKGGSTDPLLRHPTDPELLRQFTVIEHARIKGVPEPLVDGLSKTEGHIVLGQGIAYAPVYALFSRIGQNLKTWFDQAASVSPGNVSYGLKLATG